MMQKRRFLTKEQKADVLTKIAERVKAGESKYDAAFDVAGMYWQNIYRWILQDEQLWKIVSDEPYPYDAPILDLRYERTIPCFDWNVAMSKLVQGLTIRPRGSMLYRYRLEAGTLMEYRKVLEGTDWYKTDDVTIPEKAYETWMFEVVE